MPDELPKDRNARVREDAARRGLLKKRTDAEQKSIPLAPGELVDDALARGVDAGVRWVKGNVNLIQWVVLASLAGAAGWYVYDWRTTKRAESASSELARAVVDERGRIGEKPKGEEGVADVDPTPWFKSETEKRDVVGKAYEQVASDFPNSGPGLLAKLGEANVALDRREWDKALGGYRTVRESSLAKADADVRGRAIEGVGYALEGKGDADGALQAFKDLEATDARGFKELGQYHQARLLHAKGDDAKAKELLKALSEKLHAPSETKALSNLQNEVDDLLRRIDPSAAPAKPVGRQFSPEDLARFQEQMRRMQEAQKNRPGKP